MWSVWAPACMLQPRTSEGRRWLASHREPFLLLAAVASWGSGSQLLLFAALLPYAFLRFGIFRERCLHIQKRHPELNVLLTLLQEPEDRINWTNQWDDTWASIGPFMYFPIKGTTGSPILKDIGKQTDRPSWWISSMRWEVGSNSAKVILGKCKPVLVC